MLLIITNLKNHFCKMVCSHLHIRGNLLPGNSLSFYILKYSNSFTLSFILILLYFFHCQLVGITIVLSLLFTELYPSELKMKLYTSSLNKKFILLTYKYSSMPICRNICIYVLIFLTFQLLSLEKYIWSNVQERRHTFNSKMMWRFAELA